MPKVFLSHHRNPDDVIIHLRDSMIVIILISNRLRCEIYNCEHRNLSF
jgi:hypothetical protein